MGFLSNNQMGFILTLKIAPIFLYAKNGQFIRKMGFSGQMGLPTEAFFGGGWASH
jgi:hypothetical protein